ncbi:39S ribosomal protein L23, mitochondrial [Armadillidium nasatum]|uniref:Large ribosomal subunit protein uL23m n=1 Tax=Armadillidium nasatum TaxID=96803 RepID=A0A5N5SX78_9CRUS|nr:39S ribosomal protein L23, mitochondrial [Armadillidium nasatum]
MSTRWYPIYQRGNPQLRVFLPNFWMKLIKPKEKHPENVVFFDCSMEMTKFDMKNYIEKIYKVPVAKVNTYIVVVVLPRGEKFVYPDLFPEEGDAEKKEMNDAEKQMKDMLKDWEENTKHHKNRPGIPTWFGL